MLPKKLRNFNGYLDGIGYAGLITEATPPEIALQVEGHQAGGMVAPVDISMASVDKMTLEFTIAEYNPAIMGLFGKSDTPFTLRGAIGPDNVPVIIQTRGLMINLGQGTWKAGGESDPLKVQSTLTYYKQTIDGEDLLEIDAVNMVFVSGGEDLLAGMKAALGT